MKNLRITKDAVYQYLLIMLGSLVFALGQLYFIKPLHIPMGGVSGIALVTNYLWNLPIGVVSIVLNIPLFGMADAGTRIFSENSLWHGGQLHFCGSAGQYRPGL